MMNNISTDCKAVLIGNPNCGKTTFFNRVTGSAERVGNWPGVTVEGVHGAVKTSCGEMVLYDLPGIYSLTPYSADEISAIRCISPPDTPDVIINIVDGMNLTRSLYLTTELLETGIPIVVAVNLMDELQKKDISVDLDSLSEKFGCPFIGISAKNGDNLELVSETACRLASVSKTSSLNAALKFDEPIERALEKISCTCRVGRREAVSIFTADMEIPAEEYRQIDQYIKAACRELGDDPPDLIAAGRYDNIEKIAASCVSGGGKIDRAHRTPTCYADRILTGRFTAIPCFFLIMSAVFFISVTVCDVSVRFAAKLYERLPVGISELLYKSGMHTRVAGLITDGIFPGLLAVLRFLPGLFAMFVCLAFLEDSGYMARMSFIMDRLFVRFGFSGLSVIPFVVSAGCSVSGIMSTRTIRGERDRRMTVICASFIPCAAKMPILALIGAEFFDGSGSLVPFSYFVGIAAIILSGMLLSGNALISSEPSSYLMELPEYRLPALSSVFKSAALRASTFIKRAGSVVLLSSVVLWFMSHIGFPCGSEGIVFSDTMQLNDSVLGIIGEKAALIFRPLGFGNAGCATAAIMGIFAKEEIAAVLGVVGTGNMNKLSALSFTVFNLLCAPCIASIAAIRREMGSARLALFAVLYQTVFAYAVSLVIYQIGSLLSGGGSIIGAASAFAAIDVFAYFLLKKKKYRYFSYCM